MVNTEIRLIIFFVAKDGEALYSQQKQDLELTVAQIMNFLFQNSNLNWRKVGKTTRPFRYDPNQTLYDYTMEVMIKTTPKEKKCKTAKWLSEEALQTAEKRRDVKGKGEKERYTHLNSEFQRIARRDKKAFWTEQYKETGKQ